MRRDADRAALHAALDWTLRALARPTPPAPAAGAPGAPALAARPAGSPVAAPDALIGAYQGAKASLRDLATRDPLDALAGVTGTATVLFYLAERGKNPRCKDLWDALTFVTTCLSVGYHNVFAVTPAGKAIASWLMTLGPALAARALEPPRAETERAEAEAAATQRAVVERLDAILEALRAQPRVPLPPSAPPP